MKVIFWKGNNSAPSAFTNYRRYDWNVQVFPFYMDVFLKLKVYILIFFSLVPNKILYVYIVSNRENILYPQGIWFL